MALLAAWSAALNLLPSLPGTYLLKVNGFPIVLSGFILGPAGGFWVGALADVLCFLMKASGPYIPIFTLTSGLTGAGPILLYRWMFGTAPLSWLRTAVAIGLSQVAIKVLLVSTCRAILFSLPFGALALAASAEQTLHAPLYGYVVWAVWRRVGRRAALGSHARGPGWAVDAGQVQEPPTGPNAIGFHPE